MGSSLRGRTRADTSNTRTLLRWVQIEEWPSCEARRRDELLEERQAWLYNDGFANDADGGSGVADDVNEAASETASDQTSEDEGRLTITIVETAEQAASRLPAAYSDKCCGTSDRQQSRREHEPRILRQTDRRKSNAEEENRGLRAYYIHRGPTSQGRR